MNEELFPHSLLGYFILFPFFIGYDSLLLISNSTYNQRSYWFYNIRNEPTHLLIGRKKHTMFFYLCWNY